MSILFPFLVAAAVAAPQFSVERGLKDDPFSLEITPGDEDCYVLYSTDGGEPSDLVVGPLSIDTTTVVRAVEVSGDGSWGESVSHSYLFLDQVLGSAVMDPTIVEDPVYGPALERTLRELASASLVTSRPIDSEEQAVSFEWIEPAGDHLQVDCGARETGGASVGYDKDTLRLNFRSEYGASRLEADLFAEVATGLPPADDHDALTLRSGSHDSIFYLGASGQYLRNRWMDETQLEAGHVMPHGRFFHLYVDGVYEGLYHLRERFGAPFLAEYLGGDEDDWEAVNAGEVVDGTGAGWSALLAASHSYETLGEHADVQQLIDYMLINLYAANDWDWLETQNWMAGGPREASGGWVFHASDNDICLYYDADTDILDLPGPMSIFPGLLSEGHPGFELLLADRIHALLGDGGVLSAEASADRWERLAARIDDAVVAESARGGGGWWDRDDEWDSEGQRLLGEFFPRRTEVLMGQIRAAGWFPLDAPRISPNDGIVEEGSAVTITVPDGQDAQLWWSTDGQDPRQPGGEPADGATGPSDGASIAMEHSAVIQARLRRGETWGPIEGAFIEVDATPPIVLNEWNAVGEDRVLDDDGADDAMGVVEGNGGDWFELLVLEDGLDLRGWRLELRDRNGEAGTLQLTDAPLLGTLRAGTIITVAEDLPEDPSYDPDGGDWRFHLRAAADGSGEYVSASGFEVTHREWQLTIHDADGWVRFGPAGEGIAPVDGVSSREVGLLAADPSDALRRDAGAYRAGTHSTFGAPNRWEGGAQDLAELRGVVVDTDAPAADSPVDTGEHAPIGGPGCGCGGAPLRAGLGIALAALGLGLVRRRPWPLLAALTACSPGHMLATEGPEDSDTPACYADDDGDGFGDEARPAPCAQGVPVAGDCDDRDAGVHPDAAELCDGMDSDCDGLVDDDDPDLVDGLPFYADEDGDGWGDADTVVTACAIGDGLALEAGDCDDGDPAVNPGAEDLCDGVDLDCDGIAATASGASEGCAAESCLEILEQLPDSVDGAYWLQLPSGTLAQVHCDMGSDGGGWTLGFLRNSAATGSQGDFGAEDTDPDQLDRAPTEASSSSEARMAWLGLNELAWDELQLGAYLHGAETYRSRTIARDELRIDFGQDGYLLYGGDSGYYWCGGDASYTDAGLGAVNNPTGAPLDCRGHGSLGSGWDFSETTGANQGLTLCGGDGSAIMHGSWAGGWIYYGTTGAAQAIWVR